MNKDEHINFLTKFRWVDKYATFFRILPAAKHTAPEGRKLVSDVLDAAALDLLRYFEKEKRPSKATIKQILSNHMDELARTPVSAADKDFGYELFWYLAEKSGVDMRRASDSKIWGYWKVSSGKVKTVGSVRKKRIRTGE